MEIDSVNFGNTGNPNADIPIVLIGENYGSKLYSMLLKEYGTSRPGVDIYNYPYYNLKHTKRCLSPVNMYEYPICNTKTVWKYDNCTNCICVKDDTTNVPYLHCDWNICLATIHSNCDISECETRKYDVNTCCGTCKYTQNLNDPNCLGATKAENDELKKQSQTDNQGS